MADFMRTEYANPKLKQSEIANQLGHSASTLQRYRNDINMLSPYRTQITLKKQAEKVSNTCFDDNSHREPDVKRPQTTSNDLKIASNESVKNRRKKLNGGDRSDSQNDGRNLIEQAFSSN